MNDFSRVQHGRIDPVRDMTWPDRPSNRFPEMQEVPVFIDSVREVGAVLFRDIYDSDRCRIGSESSIAYMPTRNVGARERRISGIMFCVPWQAWGGMMRHWTCCADTGDA